MCFGSASVTRNNFVCLSARKQNRLPANDRGGTALYPLPQVKTRVTGVDGKASISRGYACVSPLASNVCKRRLDERARCNPRGAEVDGICLINGEREGGGGYFVARNGRKREGIE